MLPADKRLHAITGALLALIVLFLFGAPAACLCGVRGLQISLVIPLIAVVVAAIAKELSDRLDPLHHTCDPWDAIATTTGGLLILIPALLITLTWKG